MKISTTVESLLRLAWRAETAGKPKLRDAVMTLAVAESGPDESLLAERCRRLLIAREPHHWYATGTTLGHALAQDRVAAVVEKLRAMFPPVRVERMLFRGEVEDGPFRETVVPLRRVFEELNLIPARPGSSSGARRPRNTLLFPTPDDREDGDARRREMGAFYMTLLFSMAVLLNVALGQDQDADDRDYRAA